MSLSILERRAAGLLARGPMLSSANAAANIVIGNRQYLLSHKRHLARMLADPENIGSQQRHVNFDTLGSWDNRIDFGLLLQQSIKHGKPIPNISMENIGTASVIGRRGTNEDFYKVMELKPNLTYFAVFDGHGGEECARFCNEEMPKLIKHYLDQGEDNLELILQTAFLELDQAFANVIGQRSSSSSPPPPSQPQNSSLPSTPATSTSTSSSSSPQPQITPGSTATVCLLRDSIELAVAYVGDSRGYLCRDGAVVRLTNDHTAALKAEKERIINSSGFIKFDSSGRGLINGRLAMTRSLGDFDLKPYGVLAFPDTRKIEIKHGRDAFVVLTTDGISDVMSDQEVINTVQGCDKPNEAAKSVTDQALHYSCDDNATAVVVPFGAWGKYRNLSEVNNTLFSFGRQLRNSVRF